MTTTKERVQAVFAALGVNAPQAADGLAVTAPADGSLIATLAPDRKETLEQKIKIARAAQAAWAVKTRRQRGELIERFSAALKARRENLGELITLEGGKTQVEALAEVDSSADV